MLPEMYFGANALEFVHHDSGFRFEFSARDAFENVCSMPPEKEIKVKAAQTWRAKCVPAVLQALSTAPRTVRVTRAPLPQREDRRAQRAR